MVDREATCKWLVRLANILQEEEKTGDEITFHNLKAFHSHILDVMALILEAPSIPRIMKFDEVVDAQPGTVIWLEDFDKPTVIPGLVDRVFIMTRVIDFQLVQRTVTADLDKYNRTWRCWTSKPNQAEMEARPWLS